MQTDRLPATTARPLTGRVAAGEGAARFIRPRGKRRIQATQKQVSWREIAIRRCGKLLEPSHVILAPRAQRQQLGREEGIWRKFVREYSTDLPSFETCVAEDARCDFLITVNRDRKPM